MRIWIRLFRWFRILHEFFSNILNINFIFVFPSCMCIRLHIFKKRYKLFKEIKKEIRIFSILLRIVKFYQSCFTSISFRIRSNPDPQHRTQLKHMLPFRTDRNRFRHGNTSDPDAAMKPSAKKTNPPPCSGEKILL